MNPPAVRLLPLLAAGVLAFSACSGSEESGGGTGPDSSTAVVTSPDTAAVPETDTAVVTETEPTTPPDSAPTTDPEPSATAATSAPDTVAPSDDPAPTEAPTDTSAAPAELLLRENGVGPLDFGAATPADVEALFTPLFGAANNVTSTQFSDDRGTYFENSVTEEGFSYPYGITYCYQNELCVFFGGADQVTSTFVGYRQGEHPESLSTSSGVTAGSAGADFADVIVTEAGGCFSTGGGTADGVPLLLTSSGVLFSEYNEDDLTYTNNAPPVTDVTVIDVFAGEEPFFLFDDC